MKKSVYQNFGQKNFLFLVLLIFSCATYAQEKKQLTEDLMDYPFEVVDEIPVYPGCENLNSRKERKACISTSINDFVNRNFNTGLGKELGLTGISRIYVQFKISPKGVVTDVRSRAPHPALGEEGERVVGLLPNMEPAKHNGKKVTVLYALPITFNVPEGKILEVGGN